MGLDHEADTSGANGVTTTIYDDSMPAMETNGYKDIQKPERVDLIDPIDVLFPHERSPDASSLKRSCSVLGEGPRARLLDRPCEKKLKREEHNHTTLRRLRPPDRMLSPLDVADVTQLRQHLCDVRREKFLRPMVSIVTRLTFHKYNHGIFNVRVDPVKWNIPHYFEIVKCPMDLTLVKTKCLNLEYATADECAADIALVFSNACLFNPPGHVVHECAQLLAKEFQIEYNRCKAKLAAQAKRREEHSCLSCLANVCGICNEKCINFEPPLVMCSGPCHQRIKRHSVYYKTPDRMHFWCAKCYTGLSKQIVMKHRRDDVKIPKQSLVKAKFVDELTEPWVQCDDCSGWVHQICALFNTCENAETVEDIPYTCPLCRLQRAEAQVPTWTNLEKAPSETSVEEFPVALRFNPLSSSFESDRPGYKQTQSLNETTRGMGFRDHGMHKRVFDFLEDDEVHAVAVAANSNEDQVSSCISSTQLKSTPLSTFMQNWVRRFCESIDEPEVAKSIVIKVASSIKTSCTVSPVVREFVHSDTNQYPEKIDYTSKAIFVFQKIHGVEVCIFSMYVQEYDELAVIEENRKRVYIAYIDSLVYMRPRHIRTALFHEILIAYLGFSKSRGFEYAHIWACPTTRGGDFIYWCHPSFQKNPGKDRLLEWYTAMASKATSAGVAFSCEDLYTTDFEHLESQLDHHLPPYFDGDYWPSEVERLHLNPPKRGKLSKEAYEESLKGVKFRKRLVESVRLSRGSLFVIALQPKCTACSKLMVNVEYWVVTYESGEQRMCDPCHQSSKSANGVKVAPSAFVTACDAVEDVEITCPFLDHRADMLKNCEERHYQFDSFRRAKYSTMMLIYHILSTQQVVSSSPA